MLIVYEYKGLHFLVILILLINVLLADQLKINLDLEK
jgi:hypothetical protein